MTLDRFDFDSPDPNRVTDGQNLIGSIPENRSLLLMRALKDSTLSDVSDLTAPEIGLLLRWWAAADTALVRDRGVRAEVEAWEEITDDIAFQIQAAHIDASDFDPELTDRFLGPAMAAAGTTINSTLAWTSHAAEELTELDGQTTAALLQLLAAAVGVAYHCRITFSSSSNYMMAPYFEATRPLGGSDGGQKLPTPAGSTERDALSHAEFLDRYGNGPTVGMQVLPGIILGRELLMCAWAQVSTPSVCTDAARRATTAIQQAIADEETSAYEGMPRSFIHAEHLLWLGISQGLQSDTLSAAAESLERAAHLYDTIDDQKAGRARHERAMLFRMDGHMAEAADQARLAAANFDSPHRRAAVLNDAESAPTKPSALLERRPVEDPSWSVLGSTSAQVVRSAITRH